MVMWLNLQILLVLLLIHLISLLRVAENINTCRVSIQILARILKMPNAERVMQATPARQVGDPLRYINI